MSQRDVDLFALCEGFNHLKYSAHTGKFRPLIAQDNQYTVSHPIHME